LKVTIEITLRHGTDDYGLLQEFQRLFPFGKSGLGFRIKLPPDNPRVKQVLDEIERRKIPRIDYSSNKPRPKFEYNLEFHRHYDPEDFDAAKYLEIKHEVLVTMEPPRDKQGRWQIPASSLSPKIRIGCALYSGTVISDSLRQEMVDAKLIGPKFIEVVSVGEKPEQAVGKFWELRSSVTLPPMPKERVIRHEEFPDDDVHVGGIRDGEFREAEIHYAEDAFSKCEPFDVAQTHEFFCGAGWKETSHGEHRLVVSQRFRQFCLARHLDVSWDSVVRIDPVAKKDESKSASEPK